MLEWMKRMHSIPSIVFDRIIMFTLSKYLSFVFALTFPLLLLLLSTIHAIVVYHRRLRFLLFILSLSPLSDPCSIERNDFAREMHI